MLNKLLKTLKRSIEVDQKNNHEKYTNNFIFRVI